MSKIKLPTEDEVKKYSQNSQEYAGFVLPEFVDSKKTLSLVPVVKGVNPVVKVKEANNSYFAEGTENGLDITCFEPENKTKVDKQEKKSSLKKIITNPTVRKYAAIAAGVAMAIVPAFVHADSDSQAEQFDESNEMGFSDCTDLLGKLNFDVREGYNDVGISLKLSRDPIGLYVFGSNANQDTDFGDTNIKETGIDVGLYHPFEFDWGKINTGLKFGFRDINFKEYPIDRIEAKKIGAYAKFIGDNWKAFLRYNDTFDGSFEFGEEKDYNEDSLTLGFKKFLDTNKGKAYGGIDFDRYSKDFEDIGAATKRLISVYGGMLGGDVFDDIRFGIYGGSETNFDGSRDTITPGAEFRAKKIFNNYTALALKLGYQADKNLYGGAGLDVRF